MKYIDIHCHLDSPDYYKEGEDGIKEVLGRMREIEVGAITIGTDLESSKRAVKIAEENKDIWACIGMHPGLCGKPEKAVFDESEFEKLAESPKVVAIGECGLEYFHIDKETTSELQKKLFRQQIEFAIKHDKSLMLHCRDAYDEALEILMEYKKEAGEVLRGNSHFFAGNVEQAKKFLDLGFTCSFTGVITFTHDYDEVIKFLPLESIMSETDAPFVAPVPHRGKRNEPAFVVEVVKKMAQIKGISEEEIGEKILENAKRVFNLKDF